VHRLGAAVAAAMFIISIALAQTTDPKYVMDVNRVAMTFSVTDRRGHFATLTGEDFEVLDNQKSQKILEFSAESELPLRLALLIDSSTSMRDRFRFMQEAAVTFLKSAIRPAQDQAMLVSFDITPEIVSDFDSDIEMLSQRVRNLRPGGATALYDAIDLTAKRMLASAQTGRFRYAIVIFSDGDDNQSRLTRQQALESAQRINAVIFAVSPTQQNGPGQGDKILNFLTAETGGTALFPFRTEDMSRSFDTISKELRHQYNLLYRPEGLQPDGKFHVVEIRLKEGRSGYKVRAPRGYYAPPPR